MPAPSVTHKQGNTFSYAFRVPLPNTDPKEYLNPADYTMRSQLRNAQTNALIDTLQVSNVEEVITVTAEADAQEAWTIYACKFDVTFRDGDELKFSTETIRVNVEPVVSEDA